MERSLKNTSASFEHWKFWFPFHHHPQRALIKQKILNTSNTELLFLPCQIPAIFWLWTKIQVDENRWFSKQKLSLLPVHSHNLHLIVVYRLLQDRSWNARLVEASGCRNAVCLLHLQHQGKVFLPEECRNQLLTHKGHHVFTFFRNVDKAKIASIFKILHLLLKVNIIFLQSSRSFQKFGLVQVARSRWALTSVET